MATLTEGVRNYEFLQTPANGYRSFDVIPLATTPALPAGTVLAIVAGDYVPYEGDSTVSGAATAEAILCESVEAGFDGDVTALTRDAEVKLANLSATDTTGMVASLAEKGIIARDSI